MKKFLVISITLLLVMTSTAQAGMYRWIDDNGEVHFSDKVPVAASKKSHAKLNKSGGIDEQVDPAAKQKKLDLIEAKKRNKKKLADTQDIETKVQEKKQQKDENLLSTYENEDELIRYYSSKIRSVEGNSKLIEAQYEITNKKITKLQVEVSSTKHDPILKRITKKLVKLTKTLDLYQHALDENGKQLLMLTKVYQIDLARYKELTK